MLQPSLTIYTYSCKLAYQPGPELSTVMGSRIMHNTCQHHTIYAENFLEYNWKKIWKSVRK